MMLQKNNTTTKMCERKWQQKLITEFNYFKDYILGRIFNPEAFYINKTSEAIPHMKVISMEFMTSLDVISPILGIWINWRHLKVPLTTPGTNLQNSASKSPK